MKGGFNLERKNKDEVWRYEKKEINFMFSRNFNHFNNYLLFYEK